MNTHVSLLLALLVFASPASAQRLSGDIVPEHYTLWFAPDLENATFQGRETIRVELRTPTDAITLHALEIEFGEVTIEAAGQRPDHARHARRHDGDGHSHRPRTDSARRSHDPADLQRHPQRQAARVLSEPRERPQLRGHADGAHRRAACLPVVRRARLQGDVRDFDDDRSG